MMGREDARNMQSFITEWIWIISASSWLFKKQSITKHGNMNVKYCYEGWNFNSGNYLFTTDTK